MRAMEKVQKIEVKTALTVYGVCVHLTPGDDKVRHIMVTYRNTGEDGLSHEVDW